MAGIASTAKVVLAIFFAAPLRVRSSAVAQKKRCDGAPILADQDVVGSTRCAGVHDLASDTSSQDRREQRMRREFLAGA